MPKPIHLVPHTTHNASVLSKSKAADWHLEIPPGEAGVYRLAQLDDYHNRSRRNLPWRAPLGLSLDARVSAESLPGTWGFGLWNDPFGLSLGFGATSGRVPVLPNAIWFFHASPPNYLSFRDDQPSQGFLAGTFASPRWPALMLVPGLLMAPLLTLRPMAQALRRLASRIIQEQSSLVSIDVTQWNTYRLDWTQNHAVLWVNEQVALESPVSPRGPLGLVLWIDNQYAAFTPEGRIGFGTLANPSAWLELKNIEIKI
jgi:hypothetical protein